MSRILWTLARHLASSPDLASRTRDRLSSTLRHSASSQPKAASISGIGCAFSGTLGGGAIILTAAKRFHAQLAALDGVCTDGQAARISRLDGVCQVLGVQGGVLSAVTAPIIASTIAKTTMSAEMRCPKYAQLFYVWHRPRAGNEDPLLTPTHPKNRQIPSTSTTPPKSIHFPNFLHAPRPLLSSSLRWFGRSVGRAVGVFLSIHTTTPTPGPPAPPIPPHPPHATAPAPQSFFALASPAYLRPSPPCSPAPCPSRPLLLSRRLRTASTAAPPPPRLSICVLSPH